MTKYYFPLGLMLLTMLTNAVAAGKSCAALTIAPEIEVPPRDFTAADLLPPNACPALLKSAARIRLGAAPLKGIPRVFDAEEIRSILGRALPPSNDGPDKKQIAPSRFSIPARVIVRRSRSAPGTTIAARTSKSRSADSTAPIVHPGQAATLVWDRDSIRVTVPVTCLDRGAVGEAVRARIEPSGTVVRAVVVERGMLRASS